MIENNTTMSGVIFFYTIILIGIGLVSVHYRKKYETLRKSIKHTQIKPKTK